MKTYANRIYTQKDIDAPRHLSYNRTPAASISFPIRVEEDDPEPEEDEGEEKETGWSPYDPMWQRTGQAHGDHMEVGN